MAEETHPTARLEALLCSGSVKEAVAFACSLHKAAALDKILADLLLKHARGWHASGLKAEQHAVCEMLLELYPEHFEALHLLGHEAQSEGDFARAEAFYARALAAKPDYAFSRLALAQIRMLRSGFVSGRQEYEARFDAVTEGSGPDWRGLPVTRWRGESLTGRKIYLWPEQGLGDIVMFAGFLPYLQQQSPARVVLGMFPKLVTLFQRSFPFLHVEPADDAIHHALAPSVMQAYPHIERLAGQVALPFSLAPLKAAYEYVKKHGTFDFAAPMGDLLVHAMPGYRPVQHPACLKADEARVGATQERLQSVGQGRRIGISWHTTNRREGTRNIPLEEWLPLLSVPGCHFISLQHQADPEQIEQFCGGHGCHITLDRQVDLQEDAEGLAALIASLDEVITIDNSNIHLAGALGIPATLLLPVGHNFRWPEQEGGGTLWYESVSVLRQREFANWTRVVAEARQHLIARLDQTSSQRASLKTH